MTYTREPAFIAWLLVSVRIRELRMTYGGHPLRRSTSAGPPFVPAASYWKASGFDSADAPQISLDPGLKPPTD